MGVQSRFAVMNWFVTGEVFPINFVRVTIIREAISCGNVEYNELHAALNFHCCFLAAAWPLNCRERVQWRQLLRTQNTVPFAIRRSLKPNDLTKVSKQKNGKNVHDQTVPEDYIDAWNITLDDQYLKCRKAFVGRSPCSAPLNDAKHVPRTNAMVLVAPFEIVSLNVRENRFLCEKFERHHCTGQRHRWRKMCAGKIKQQKSYKSRLLLTMRASNNGENFAAANHIHVECKSCRLNGVRLAENHRKHWIIYDNVNQIRNLQPNWSRIKFDICNELHGRNSGRCGEELKRACEQERARDRERAI